MRPSRRSPTYTIRNPYGYCFRMIVPKDLRKFVGKTEMRYSLKTGNLREAKEKSRLMAGLTQHYFRRIRKLIDLKELSETDIQWLINDPLRAWIDQFEEIRVNGPFAGDYSDMLQKWPHQVAQYTKNGLR